MSSGFRSSCYWTDWNWANTENIHIGLVFAVLAQCKFLYCIDRFDHIKANKSKLINNTFYRTSCDPFSANQRFQIIYQNDNNLYILSKLDIPPRSTIIYLSPYTWVVILSVLSIPFNLSWGKYWQYIDAASGSSAIISLSVGILAYKRLIDWLVGV